MYSRLLFPYQMRIRLCKRMIYLKTHDQYFSLNRILLLAIGLWPYQQSNFTRLQFIFLSTILTSSFIFQCTPLISQKCTPDFVAKVLSSASFFALFVVKYNMFCINMEAVKDLLEQLQLICNELKDNNEFAIINEYGCSAKRVTAALTICGICSVFAIIAAQFSSKIFDFILPINVSQIHRIPITVEYFVDQEKYSYWILLHINVAFCVGATAMVGIGTTLIAYLQYTCGMFKIASYRIEHAMNNNMLRNNNLKNKFLIFEGLIFAVDMHRHAMKLSKHLLSSIEPMMFCLIIFGVASVSLNLYRIFQITSLDDTSLNVKELIMPSLCAGITILYMFLSNYIGQHVTDHNHDIFVTVYNIRWYVAPLHIQRMVLFLLQRKSKEFILNVGLFVVSIEFFATLYIPHNDEN
ncbi:uncharacterized protein LOC109609776 isoform X2 [Camponotus floridanus]|uniref:uncharacterized protein LOC109609776 isoform X2 n=1 Tax=Camponotus floridanus TaxID=104421 RepID=UPI000DC66486|nr:uncharacterized protein LOC109609776 isoform X2 [Camponotus floridanus]